MKINNSKLNKIILIIGLVGISPFLYTGTNIFIGPNRYGSNVPKTNRPKSLSYLIFWIKTNASVKYIESGLPKYAYIVGLIYSAAIIVGIMVAIIIKFSS